MKSHININRYKNIMTSFKPFLILVLLSILFVNNGYSTNDIVLNWRLNEGDGILALDSINNNYGIVNNANFDTGTKYAGFSSLFCNNADDYLSTVNNIDINTNNTFNFWIYRKDRAGYVTLFTIHSSVDSFFQLEYNKDTTLYRVSYLDSTDTLRTQTFANVLPKEAWTMLTFSVAHDENRIIVKQGGTQIYNNVMAYTFKDQVDNTYFKLCNNILNNVESDSYIDEVTLLNFIPNSTIETLLLSNDILAINEILTNETDTGDDDNDTPLENVTSILPIEIIKTFSPSNLSNVTNPVEISYTTKFNANCDLYVNGVYLKTFINKISGTYTSNYEIGENDYSLYCYVVDEQVLKYDFLDRVSFNVNELDNGTLTFIVTGSDYDVNDLDLYLVTPCIDYTASVGSFGQDVNQRMNEGESFYFQKLNNGQASFLLDANNHEFCILNGFVQYSQNGYTTDYNINNVYGIVNLGKINVPSNVTSSYTVSTELIDVYDKVDVKAYGLNWGSVIASLFLILIGFIVLASGMSGGNGKIVIGGVLLILAGCGIAFNGVLGVLF